jgi:hypothetical protein
MGLMPFKMLLSCHIDTVHSRKLKVNRWRENSIAMFCLFQYNHLLSDVSYSYMKCCLSCFCWTVQKLWPLYMFLCLVLLITSHISLSMRVGAKLLCRYWMSSHCRSLYNGLSAGLQRQMCFASVRLGLYDSVKTLYQQMLDGTLQPWPIC